MPTVPALRQRVLCLVTCTSIVLNALCAGGIFTFPLMSPSLASHLKLTQPQLTTIVLAGVAGQYPLAAGVGKVIDRYGPWAASLFSSFLFTLGYGFFTLKITKEMDTTQISQNTPYFLAFYFLLAGLGTAFSLFSILFAATKNFPRYVGVASGASSALFGLSPLFLSTIASSVYLDQEKGLDVVSYLKFLTVLCGGTHFLGAFMLRTPPPLPKNPRLQDGTNEADERTALLPKPDTRNPQDGTAFDLLRDPSFWILWMVAFINLGTCEMVMSNLGSIVMSLPSTPSPSTSTLLSDSTVELATATQIRLFSLANTCSRLVVGPLADFVSPAASCLPIGTMGFSRKHHVSRIVFLTGSSALLALTFAWTEIGVRSQQVVWALSVGIGIVYGSVFTVIPSILSSIWGLSNLGRNFGIITYAAFVGTPTFSYLYAFVAARHAREGTGVCVGVQCWRHTFWICASLAVVSCMASGFLWRRWKGRL